LQISGINITIKGKFSNKKVAGEVNSFIKNYKENFLKKQKITYRKLYLSEEDNEKVAERYKKDTAEVNREYKSEVDTEGKKYFYTEKFEEATDEEISLFVKMKLVEKLNDIDYKLYTMRFIMIFGFILTIIGMLMYIGERY
jgi:uncharacterized protein YaaW (UPF0174 family)